LGSIWLNSTLFTLYTKGFEIYTIFWIDGYVMRGVATGGGGITGGTNSVGIGW